MKEGVLHLNDASKTINCLHHFSGRIIPIFFPLERDNRRQQIFHLPTIQILPVPREVPEVREQKKEAIETC